jgi:hypothetical protein
MRGLLHHFHLLIVISCCATIWYANNEKHNRDVVSQKSIWSTISYDYVCSISYDFVWNRCNEQGMHECISLSHISMMKHNQDVVSQNSICSTISYDFVCWISYNFVWNRCNEQVMHECISLSHISQWWSTTGMLYQWYNISYNCVCWIFI